MTINKTAEGSKLTLTLMGRLDTMTAPRLEEVVRKELDGMTEVVMDFEKLDHLSSVGLRVILAAKKIVKKQGDMVILHVNEIIMEVFDVTGFSGILSIQG